MSEKPSGGPSLTDRLVVLRPLLGLVIVLGLFAALLAQRGELGAFLSLGNFQVLMHANSVAAVLALGMLIVIVSGGIDLSVGSVVALVTVVTMQAYSLVYAGTVDHAGIHHLFRSGTEPWRGTQSVLLASLAAGCAGCATG